jgi:hypothetical protein
MISVFYQNTKIADESVRSFINSNLGNFCEEINLHLQKTSRIFDQYHLIEYGEQTLVNLFANGIARYDSQDFLNVLCEFGYNNIKDKVTGKEDNSGRVDIIVENIATYDVFFIEAKICQSNENAPTTEQWKNIELIKEGYRKLLNQANKYLAADYKNYLNPELEEYKSMRSHTFYSVALVFDVVKFTEQSYVKLWNYIPMIDNEYYTFKTYPHKKRANPDQELLYGLACYGKIEKMVI